MFLVDVPARTNECNKLLLEPCLIWIFVSELYCGVMATNATRKILVS
jgi:hypothetical protein